MREPKCSCGTCSYCKRLAYTREWHQKNPERTRANRERWKRENEERYREVRQQISRRYRERHGSEIRAANEKSRARDRVRYAIKTGRLVRQPCEECGAEKTQAHHADYDKSLDVTWLCASCHKKAHLP